MNNFVFYNPTAIIFGEGRIEVLGEKVKKYADKVLLVYGKGSIKKNGVYDAVMAQFKVQGIETVELSGVDPNPRITTVREGAALCREHGLEFILAVGGGSVIDCVKGIAAAAKYEGDAWDFWSRKAQPKEALPFGTVLTLSATGSEMNSGTVITNMETMEKHGMGGPMLFPQFSILDPTYTYSLPPRQTAAGVADIMTHVYEFYFTHVDGAYLQDALAEAVMKTCVKYGPIAMEKPEDYVARANLMWASSMALNGVVSNGKVFEGFNHIIEHGISAVYDLTHGVGLAILAPHWMDYVLNEKTAGKLAQFAENVFDVSEGDTMEKAKAGIQKLKDFYHSLGLPSQLSEEGIGSDRLDEVIEQSSFDETIGNFMVLTKEDVKNILMKAA